MVDTHGKFLWTLVVLMLPLNQAKVQQNSARSTLQFFGGGGTILSSPWSSHVKAAGDSLPKMSETRNLSPSTSHPWDALLAQAWQVVPRTTAFSPHFWQLFRNRRSSGPREAPEPQELGLPWLDFPLAGEHWPIYIPFLFSEHSMISPVVSLVQGYATATSWT